jgi:hypothetical protein
MAMSYAINFENTINHQIQNKATSVNLLSLKAADCDRHSEMA